MDRNSVIAVLKAHRDRLGASGVRRLSLFGSTARGEQGPVSDIDLAFVPGDGFSEGGFDYFAKVDALKGELTTLLEHPVDLVDEFAANSTLKTAIERDRVVAFG